MTITHQSFFAPVSDKKLLEEDEYALGGLGTDFIAESLRNNLKVINIPMYLREKKLFSYPRSGNCWQRDEVKKCIQKYLDNDKKKVYVFNNEELYDPLFRSIPHFYPKLLYSVASGLKPYTLLKEIYKRTGEIPSLNFF